MTSLRPSSVHTTSTAVDGFSSPDSSLIPPTVPFAPGGGSGSRSPTSRPRSLHYLPTKFSVPHKQGQWAHRKTKEGGGRAAFGAVSPIDGGHAPQPGGGTSLVSQGGQPGRHPLPSPFPPRLTPSHVSVCEG